MASHAQAGPTVPSLRATPLHVGAVTSAISEAYPKSALIAWGIGGVVALTRIILLAHWTTNVLAGLTVGVIVERCLRPLTLSKNPG
jgi:hypothetical protein